MKTLFYKIKAFFKDPFKVKEKLPQGVAEFHVWAESIITHYGLPLNDSVKFAIATLILHAKEDAAYLSKEYFGHRAIKSAANQVAAGVMQDLKEAQAARIKAEAEAAAIAAATPTDIETTATVVEPTCGAV